MKGITTRQQKLLTYIEQTFADTGVVPSYRDMCDATGITSTSAVSEHLRVLARRGFLGMWQPTRMTVRETDQQTKCDTCQVDGKALDLRAGIAATVARRVVVSLDDGSEWRWTRKLGARWTCADCVLADLEGEDVG